MNKSAGRGISLLVVAPVVALATPSMSSAYSATDIQRPQLISTPFQIVELQRSLIGTLETCRSFLQENGDQWKLQTESEQPMAESKPEPSNGSMTDASDNDISSDTAKSGGCWRDGKWYAEGTRIDVPIQSRLAVGGYTICRNGKWVFVAK